MSFWLTEHKWIFMIAAFVFLGMGFYLERRSTSLWSKTTLYGTLILSAGLVIYAYLFR